MVAVEGKEDAEIDWYSEISKERPHWGRDVWSLYRGWSHLGGSLYNGVF